MGTRSYDESTPIIAPEHVDAIKELLLERWELTAPGLLISVTGNLNIRKTQGNIL